MRRTERGYNLAIDDQVVVTPSSIYGEVQSPGYFAKVQLNDVAASAGLDRGGQWQRVIA
jgi:hypothetical protein